MGEQLNFCTSCGAKLQPRGKFCANCRTPVPNAQSSGSTRSPQVGNRAAGPPTTNTLLPDNPGASSPNQPQGFKKPSRKLVILSVVGIVIVALGVTGFAFVQNLLRGGAASPEQAAEKVVESISSKDMIGLFTLVPPHERDAVQRTQEAVMAAYKDFDIADAIQKTTESNSAAAPDELSFDGIELEFRGVTPHITELSQDLALINFRSGELHIQIDPEQTKGVINTAYAAAGTADSIDHTVMLADLGPDQSGLTLVVTKSDNRWYVSPLYSGLEMAHAFSGTERGLPPSTPVEGSDSPREAAQSAVAAVPSFLSNYQAEALAPYLVEHEANAIYLYGDLLSRYGIDGSFGGEAISLGDNTFRDGASSGSRATAVVQNISIGTEYGDKIRFTDKCVGGDDDMMCLNGSAYNMAWGSPQLNPISYLSNGSELALTTLKEDGKWKVSLLDTAADNITGVIKSLNREQALALLDLARAEEAQSAITLGTETPLTFNSAGFAVVSLGVEKAQMLELAPEAPVGDVKLYSADGRTELSFSEEVPAGKYKVLVYAEESWTEKFATAGSSIEHNGKLLLREYIAPPTVDGNHFETSGSLGGWFGSEDSEHTLQVPAGNTVDLVFRVPEFDNLDDEENRNPAAVVTVDGQRYAIPLSSGEEQVIPYPDDNSEHTVTVDISGNDSPSFLDVSYELEFIKK